MFELKPMARGVALAFSGTLAATLIVGSANAQAPGSQQQMERVEITGSLIRRTETETALPVVTLRADELRKSGATNAEQVVQLITQNQSAVVTANSVGGTNGGAAHADLRGLGASRTLVLVNGRRMVSNPYDSVAVDLNTIPMAAIDRVEVLTDGASSIYGSDAVSGVINFIMRRDFSGVDVSAEYQTPQQSGGGDRTLVNLTGGWGTLAKDRFNIMGSISYTKQDGLKATDRDFAKSAVIADKGVFKASPTTFPANYTQGSTVEGNPTLPGCQPPNSLFLPDVFGTGACGFDYVPFINIIPEQEQWSGVIRGSMALGQDHVASLEYLKATNKVDTIISPTPLTGLSMPPTNPFYPGGPGGTRADPTLDTTQPIDLGWRTTVAGGRASRAEGDTDRWLAELDGRIATWDYKVGALYSSATSKIDFTGGYLNNAGIRAGLAGTGGAPFLNPFGPQSGAGDAYIQSQLILGELQNAEAKLKGITATGTTELLQMPGGPLSIALGAEYYKNEVSFRNNFSLIRQAASSGLAGAEDIDGDRNWWAAVAELNVPVAKGVELGFAVRYDDYSDFGSTWNPKFTARWQVMPELLLRGSYNTGFRAPTLNDVFAPNSITFTARRYNDPVLCPGGVANTAAGGIATRDCNIQFSQQLGGNRDIDAETSAAFTLGFIAQPIRQVSFGVDYFNYRVKNTIGVLGESTIFGDANKYAPLFVRCSAAAAATRALIDACGIAGGDPLAYIQNTQLNLGNFKTQGFDLSATWMPAATPYGNFSIGYRGTYLTKYEYQLEPSGDYFDNLGNYFNGVPVLRYQHIMNFNWLYGPWNTTLINRYRGGYIDANDEAGIDPAFFQSVDSYITWDLTVDYTGFKNTTLSLGVLNLMDKDPPFSNQGDAFQVGYDQRFADPRGRTWVFRARYRF